MIHPPRPSNVIIVHRRNMYSKSDSIDEEIDNLHLLQCLPVFRRLDVAPFVVCYPFLIYFTWSNYATIALIALTITLMLHVIIYMLSQSSPIVRIRLSFKLVDDVSKAHYVYVKANAYGSSSIVALCKRQSMSTINILSQSLSLNPYFFEYHKSIYDYDENMKVFKRQPNLICRPISVKQVFLHRGHASKTFALAKYNWGENDLDFPIPDFMELYIEHLVSPFFVFQSLCLLLWSLDDYWYYSMCTFFMLLLFEGMMCRQRQNSLLNLRSMRRPAVELMVFRENQWKSTSSFDIVPGDIICLEIVKDKNTNDYFIPCDILLLNGTCVTNEAMLTGESIPQLKESLQNFEDGPSATINITDVGTLDEKTKRCVLFGGTNLVSANRNDDSDTNTEILNAITGVSKTSCVGICLQTGFNSLQGKLVRKILFAKEGATAVNTETYFFIIILVICAAVASSYVLLDGIGDIEKNKFKLCLHCIMIITSVIPPELPMELSLAITTSLAALAKNLIYCTEPHRIPYAGKIDVFCFDKTGTLTQDKMRFLGVAVPFPGGINDLHERISPKTINQTDNEDITDVNECSDLVKCIIGACHSLFISGKSLVGDMLEVEAMKSSGFVFAKPNDFDTLLHTGLGIKVSVIRRFQFSSSLKRMSAIVKLENSDQSLSRKFVFVKGAPEVIANMLEEIPDFYWSVLNQNASKGHRILALAYRTLDIGGNIGNIVREDIENNLTFAGFILFSSDLKADSKSVVRELKDSSNKIIMITGDSMLTSLDVARRVGIIDRKRESLVLKKLPDDSFVWRASNKDCVSDVPLIDDFMFNEINLAKLSKEKDLCITGDSLEFFKGSTIFDELCQNVAIFTRMTPSQKTSVVVSLKNSKQFVLMCGDGTNDVGALRSAHVGISVVNDAEIESHLTKVKANIDKLGKTSKSSNTKSDRLLRAMVEAQMQEADPTIVQLGDASLASSFTSRRTSIDSVLSVIRQGRCTLVTTIQVYKILALNCLVSAYVMSWMHTKGLRQGDVQMTAVGIMNAGLFFFLSQTKPIEHLASQKPVSSIFAKSVLVSVLGQCFIHLCCLVSVIIMCGVSNDQSTSVLTPDGTFQPNLCNSCVFLLSLVININNFVVNYHGYPYTQSLKENSLLFRVVIALYFGVAAILGGQLEFVNDFFQMKPFPSSTFQVNIGIILILNFLLSYAIDSFSRQL